MSVTRRALPSGNVTWRAKVFFEGRVIAQRSFGRRVDAKRWEADQLAKLDAGSWIDPARGRMTFAALAEEWQASRGHLAVRSQETTRFLLDKYVIPEIGAYPISGISAADVERVMSALTARGLATATRRRALSMMRLVFDYAIRDRRLSVNVARMVALPRGGTKREPHWLRPEQLGRLVMAVPPLCQPVAGVPRDHGVPVLGDGGAAGRRRRANPARARRPGAPGGDAVEADQRSGVRSDEDPPDADRADASGAGRVRADAGRRGGSG